MDVPAALVLAAWSARFKEQGGKCESKAAHLQLALHVLAIGKQLKYWIVWTVWPVAGSLLRNVI